MSTRAVLIALGLAALLSIITAVSLRPKGVDSRPVPIIAGDLSACKAFKATHADGSRQEFALDATSGEWIMSSFDKAGVGGRNWSVPESRVKGALRMVGEARTMGVILGGDQRPGTTVEFTLGAGPAASLWLEPDGLGGRVGAKLLQDGSPERRFFVPTEIAELFRPQNLAEWRDTGLISTQLGDPSRIAIKRGDRSLKLARVGKNWSIQEPLGVAADTKSVLKLISTIAKLRLDRFEGSAQGSGLEPELLLVVETDLPPGKGGEQRLTASETLRFSCRTPSDELWNAVVESRLGEREGKPQVFRGDAAGPIQSAALRAMSVDPADYASRVMFAEFSQADIATVTLGKMAGTTPFELARRGTNWVDVGAGQELTPGYQAQLGVLLTLMCETPAGAVRVGPPEGAIPAAELTLKSPSGQTMGVAILATLPQSPDRNSGPGKTLLWFGNGQVWRGIEPAQPGLSDWILANIR